MLNTISGILATITELALVLSGDINRLSPDRDSSTGFYQVPIHTHNHIRNSPREFVLSTIASGAPLTFQPSTLVTKVLFDTTGAKPQATGVAFLQGQSLYQAGK